MPLDLEDGVTLVVGVGVDELTLVHENLFEVDPDGWESSVDAEDEYEPSVVDGNIGIFPVSVLVRAGFDITGLRVFVTEAVVPAVVGVLMGECGCVMGTPELGVDEAFFAGGWNIFREPEVRKLGRPFRLPPLELEVVTVLPPVRLPYAEVEDPVDPELEIKVDV